MTRRAVAAARAAALALHVGLLVGRLLLGVAEVIGYHRGRRRHP